MSEWPEKRDFHNRANQTVPIRLGLLGTVSLTLGDGREIEVSSKKNRALLAILALAPGHQATRERLCGLLWSDRGEEQARGSLRQSLAVLRDWARQIPWCSIPTTMWWRSGQRRFQ